MARKSSPIATVIIIALALVLLFALNPTTADFQAWMSGRAESHATEGTKNGTLGNAFGKLIGKATGAVSSLFAGGYTRRDYLIFSTYSLGGRKGDLYLGAAHLFLKIR